MRYTLEVTAANPTALYKMLTTDIDPRFSEVFMTGADILRQEGHKQGLAEGMAKGLEQGIAKGIAKGLKKGMTKGLEQGLEQGLADMRALVANLLRLKLGPLPASALARLDTAEMPTLNLYSERVLTAHSLDDVFRER